MMRAFLAPVVILALSGCASNPLQNAGVWEIEKCAEMRTPQVKFTRSSTSTNEVISRTSCEAIVAAAANIGQVAYYHADKLFLADSDDVNAYATVDGAQRPVIVVTFGMLRALRSDETAWAGLLGHEIAHHVKNHGQGRDEAKAGAQTARGAAGNVIATLIPGVGGFIAGNAASFVVGNAMYGAYTRPQEREADELGLKWMIAAGYDPEGMLRLFEVLAKYSTGLPVFLSTHPGAEDRGQMVREYIQANPQVTAKSSEAALRQEGKSGAKPSTELGTPIAALNCQDATSTIRLTSLCLTPNSCQKEIRAIQSFCKNGDNSKCREAQSNLAARCDARAMGYTDKSCAGAAERVRDYCRD